jgi:hypothetical protein
MNQDLGYILYPPRRESEPGYSRLDVILRDIPTEHHFDPLEVHLDVAALEEDVLSIMLEHPWPRREKYQACAGMVELIDRKGKHLEVFILGGSLQVEPEAEHTTLILASPAPIFLPAESPLDELLVEEAEILFAQRHATREITPGVYEKHLVEAPPLELYHAVLMAIRERYRLMPPSENELTLKLKHILREEIKALEEQLSALHRRPLEGLL